jgi:DNA replication and repair protein RecF
MYLFTQNHPVIALSERDQQVFSEYFYVIRRKISETGNHFRRNLVRALMLAMFYDLSNVVYQSRLDEKPLNELLDESLQQDRYSGYTNVGIHKDDLEFTLDGHPLKRFGSQGQQKSFVVSIRLAQFEFNYQKIGYKPILLLDDIFDKLDDQRVMKLVRLVGDEHFGQVFITDTQQGRVEKLFENTNIDHKIFEVVKGQVKEIGGGDGVL